MPDVMPNQREGISEDEGFVFGRTERIFIAGINFSVSYLDVSGNLKLVKKSKRYFVFENLGQIFGGLSAMRPKISLKFTRDDFRKL